MHSKGLSEIDSIFESGLQSPEDLIFQPHLGGSGYCAGRTLPTFIALFEQGTQKGTGERRKGLRGTERVVSS